MSISLPFLSFEKVLAFAFIRRESDNYGFDYSMSCLGHFCDLQCDETIASLLIVPKEQAAMHT